MADIRLSIYKEVKDKKTGKSTWNSSVMTTSAINLEDISVTTTSERMVFKEGEKPRIVPFGVKGQGGRIASIVGTFKGKSLQYLSTEDAYLDVLQKDVDGELGYAMGVFQGFDEIPELGPKTARWQIEQFNWDRAARQLGQWKFNLSVSYIWNPDLNEIKLYANGVGNKIPDNVKFKALVGLSNGGYNNASSQMIMQPKVKTSIIALNTATFTSTTPLFEKDDIIHIYCQTDTANAIFFGIIKEVRKNSNFTFTYDCIEIGSLLDRVMCSKIGPGLFKPRIKIPNPINGKYLKLKSMVAYILDIYKNSMLYNYDPKYGTDKTNKWGNQGKIPGDGEISTLSDLPQQVLSGMSIYKALTRLLEDQCGLYIWFDNNTGALEYGFLRNPYTINPELDVILMSEPTFSNTEDYVPDNVVLYNDKGHHVYYPKPWANGSYIAYQYNSTMNDIMMDKMVQKIHKDLQTDRSTFKVRFPAGTVKFRDGDVFTGLGDSTIDPVMPYRDDVDYDPLVDLSDTVWQIKDMTITDTYTEIIVGPSYYSVFDLFRSTLKVIPESPVIVEQVTKETNQVPISTQANVALDHLGVV